MHRDPAAPADDWDPRSPAVLDDQVAAYDAMRARCPVAHSEYLGWSLFRHADVLRAIEDPDTFSSAVSTHLNVPNGMDPPEHTVFRELVDRYFTDELVDDEIRLRACPFREAAARYPQVVCQVHGGLAQRLAEQAVGGGVHVRLTPFVEPGLCVLTLTRPAP